MRCEVVAVGTELLLGQIVDTNSSWIGENLALIGIDSLFQVKVGDNFGRMEATIRQALERSDAVICCGGLGPTQDDITRDVIAAIMGVEMVRDDAIADHIRDIFEGRGRPMPENNLRQADVPAGATTIAQMPGTAPGLVCPVGDKVIYAVPGVPHEMREMMAGTVLDDLRRRSGETSVIHSRVIRTWGYGESALAETLADHVDALDESGHATIAFQASGIEGIKVRVTAKAESHAAAEKIIAAEVELINEQIGDHIFGYDDETMESVVLDTLREHDLTVAAGESLTGGILSTRITALDPNMEVFRGAVVSPVGDLDGEDGAIIAARAARDAIGTDIGIAVIGPNDPDAHPPGTVFAAVALPDGDHAKTVALPGVLSRMRSYAVITLLDLLRKRLD
ncbi:MAG: CinA family nicotinamide mononucleotide deamidase-related protein [Rhodospirillaceae bacterium]|jgi:nicotinamide-nucleotide amidase|nr:CinA family nicotinamide mononucleotide deamidase-related protein [Rhodospirillaceae bacterium]MBT6405438.1 CinA family nicotinamide mononucleotide deamidase-related protein [Rhodospirillaceae bacterium]MBT6535356.1 CinA family nicotinamide mononucleotide deamidase-related protein [Rhodospirillaceae bacterium]